MTGIVCRFDNCHIEDALKIMSNRKIGSIVYNTDNSIEMYATIIVAVGYTSYIHYLNIVEEFDYVSTYVIISKTSETDKERFFINILYAEELLEELNRKRKFTFKFMGFEKTFEYSIAEIANNPKDFNLAINFEDKMDDLGIFTTIDTINTISSVERIF